MTRRVDLEAAVAAVRSVGGMNLDEAFDSAEAALRALPSVGEACPTCGRSASGGYFFDGQYKPCSDPFHTPPLSPGGPGDERPEVAPIDEAGLVEAVTLFQEEWGAYQSGSGTGSHERRWLRLERSVEGLFAALAGRGK